MLQRTLSANGTILPLCSWVLLPAGSRSRFGEFLTLNGPYVQDPIGNVQEHSLTGPSTAAEARGASAQLARCAFCQQQAKTRRSKTRCLFVVNGDAIAEIKNFSIEK